MKVVMGMQIENSEKHGNSAVDWKHQGADSWEKCLVNFELKKNTDYCWLTIIQANSTDHGASSIELIWDFLLYSILLITTHQIH